MTATTKVLGMKNRTEESNRDSTSDLSKQNKVSERKHMSFDIIQSEKQKNKE